MTSAFTPNKGIEQPASGDYVNAWATPVNADWAIIDKALGGTTSLSLTGIPAGTISLTLSQYQPPDIEFSGVQSGNFLYQIPAGVGGFWSISNFTTGTGTISFGIASGNSVAIGLGRTFVVSNGVNVGLGDTTTAAAAESAAISAAESYANSTFVRLTTNVGSMTGVVVQADPGGTPSGSAGQMFLYY